MISSQNIFETENLEDAKIRYCKPDADEDISSACFHLASLYHTSSISDEKANYWKAYVYNMKGAKRNHALCFILMQKFADLGIKEAYEYFIEAAKAGNEKAFQYLKEEAEKGDEIAQKFIKDLEGQDLFDLLNELIKNVKETRGKNEEDLQKLFKYYLKIDKTDKNSKERIEKELEAYNEPLTFFYRAKILKKKGEISNSVNLFLKSYNSSAKMDKSLKNLIDIGIRYIAIDNEILKIIKDNLFERLKEKSYDLSRFLLAKIYAKNQEFQKSFKILKDIDTNKLEKNKNKEGLFCSFRHIWICHVYGYQTEGSLDYIFNQSKKKNELYINILFELAKSSRMNSSQLYNELMKFLEDEKLEIAVAFLNYAELLNDPKFEFFNQKNALSNFEKVLKYYNILSGK